MTVPSRIQGIAFQSPDTGSSQFKLKGVPQPDNSRRSPFENAILTALPIDTTIQLKTGNDMQLHRTIRTNRD